MLFNKLFPEEKFIIHSTMNQDDILGVLKENTQDNLPPLSLFPSNHEYFVGKISGFKFRIRRSPDSNKNWRRLFPFIQGEIKGNSIIVIMNSFDLNDETKTLTVYILDIGYAVALFFGVLFFYFLFKHGLNIDFYFWFPVFMFFVFICFIIPLASRVEINNEKEHIKKLFNGTIKKQF